MPLLFVMREKVWFLRFLIARALLSVQGLGE
ncbi:hypothetical protein OIU74_021487 [Salix koriyanagi]|uniref:Uncharacterized protein n=1 Tax=Salix koriyanagi TaxID=2511006 RepID=A0A9Q0WI09_9ROSI|nr:hypothetical protein OIU74_021487 [Salix koriyanagi]